LKEQQSNHTAGKLKKKQQKMSLLMKKKQQKMSLLMKKKQQKRNLLLKEMKKKATRKIRKTLNI